MGHLWSCQDDPTVLQAPDSERCLSWGSSVIREAVFSSEDLCAALVEETVLLARLLRLCWGVTSSNGRCGLLPTTKLEKQEQTSRFLVAGTF